MTKKKSYNPFRMWSTYVWGFLISITYISLIIASNTIFGIVDDSKQVCVDNCNEISACIEQCNNIQAGIGGRFAILETIVNYQISTNILIVIGLFITGFIIGWGIGSLKRIIVK